MQQLANLGAQFDAFRLAREHAAALADEFLVVIVPGRAGQRKQALALGVTLLRIGRRIEEDVHVIEGRDQPYAR